MLEVFGVIDRARSRDRSWLRKYLSNYLMHVVYIVRFRRAIGILPLATREAKPGNEDYRGRNNDEANLAAPNLARETDCPSGARRTQY